MLSLRLGLSSEGAENNIAFSFKLKSTIVHLQSIFRIIYQCLTYNKKLWKIKICSPFIPQ